MNLGIQIDNYEKIWIDLVLRKLMRLQRLPKSIIFTIMSNILKHGYTEITIYLSYNVPRGACPVLDTGFFALVKGRYITINFTKKFFKNVSFTMVMEHSFCGLTKEGSEMCVEWDYFYSSYILCLIVRF
jgi:hypothetical protein